MVIREGVTRPVLEDPGREEDFEAWVGLAVVFALGETLFGAAVDVDGLGAGAVGSAGGDDGFDVEEVFPVPPPSLARRLFLI